MIFTNNTDNQEIIYNKGTTQEPLILSGKICPRDENEPFETTLKRFKKYVLKSEIIKDYRKHDFYKSKSIKRREKHEAAQKREMRAKMKHMKKK